MMLLSSIACAENQLSPAEMKRVTDGRASVSEQDSVARFRDHLQLEGKWPSRDLRRRRSGHDIPDAELRQIDWLRRRRGLGTLLSFGLLLGC